MSAIDAPQPCREKKPFLPDKSDTFRLEMNRPESNKLAADSPSDPQNSSNTGPGNKEAASSHREESVWLRLQQALLLFQGISQHCTKCKLCIALTALLIGIGIGIGIGIPIGKGIEKENYTTPPTTTPITCSPSCPDKWTSYNGTCYFASHEERDYNSSKYFCAEQGATLLLLNNETMEVMEHLRMSSNFWIGLRRNPGGPWQWENGTFYTVTMPDDNENRNCAYFHGEISALDCSTPRVFICVKN